jgi:predicted dehydrogenase
MVQLSLSGAKAGDREFRALEVPESYSFGWPDEAVPGNVARMYGRLARDLREGTRTAPTFEDAVTVHRLLAAIEQAAGSGRRTALV